MHTMLLGRDPTDLAPRVDTTRTHIGTRLNQQGGQSCLRGVTRSPWSFHEFFHLDTQPSRAPNLSQGEWSWTEGMSLQKQADLMQ